MKSVSVELRHRLEDDLHYWIDCAEESRWIAPDTAVWARFFCPNLAHIIERGDDDEACSYDDWQEAAAQEAERVNRAYIDWFGSWKTAKEHKCAVLGFGIYNAHHYLDETARYVAENTVQEANPYSFNSKPSSKRQWTIKARNPLTKEGHYDIAIFDVDGFTNADQRYINTLNNTAGMYTRYQQCAAQFPTEIRAHHIGLNRPFVHGIDARARKTLRRGIDLLTDLLGYEQTRRFVSAREPLLIEGQQISFRLSLSKPISELSHGTMNTEVLVGNERVCNLCIYTPETPPLDHVASIITHVRAGLEGDLIKTGNPNNIIIAKPTGIEVLDQRLWPAKRERIRVDSIRPQFGQLEVMDDADVDYNDLVMADGPEMSLVPFTKERIIRLGDSDLTKSIRDKRAKRVLRHMYDKLDLKLPKLSIIET